MSNTVITNYTDLNGPSTKADSSVVVIVNKDGSLSVDQNLLGTLMGTDGSQAAGISVVRVGHEGKPDDATDSESDDDQVPHVTLSVDSYYDEPNSIIKYDSGAEMLQSLRIETRENSLIGFHNDHCYTPFTSPSQTQSQSSDTYTGYDDPVIEITHTPPPKPVPNSKKITILEQKIIPKGKKLVLNPKESPIILKGNDVLNKPLPVLSKAKNVDLDKASNSPKSDDTESSSISSGDSIPDRDSDSDYRDTKDRSGSFKVKKAKAKPRILKSASSTKQAKLDPKVASRLKSNKAVLKKEIKEKIQIRNISEKKMPSQAQQNVDLESLIPSSEISLNTPSGTDQIKTISKPTPKTTKKEKKTPAHVTALLSDMTSLFSTPDVIRRVSTDKNSTKSDPKVGTLPKTTDTNRGEKMESIKGIEEHIEKTKAVPSKSHLKQKTNVPSEKVFMSSPIPQLDDASLAQILQDTSGITNPVKIQPSISAGNAMSSPGLAGPLSPTLDLLGGLQPEEEGLTEDLLMHVAQLVESSENLQEVIDKQVLGKVDTTPGKTPVQSPFQQTPSSLYAQTLTKSAKNVVTRKDTPIEIVRRDGRVITLPPIEAPATRASKRKSQMETPSAADVISTPTAAPIQHVASPELQMQAVTRNYVNKKLANKKQEQEVHTPVVDKVSAESQESWNSEDDPYRLWCICKQPHNNRFMICCDGCEDWFHGKCVNITKAMGQQMEEQGIEWRCPNCIKKTPKATPKVIPKILTQKKITPDGPMTSQSLLKDSASKTSCIVCKKHARASSIYCSDACILKHAQDSLSTQGPSSRPDSDKHDKKITESRVIVYERKSGRLLAGPNAPTAENLKAWLQKNPTFEVVRPGTLSTIKPNIAKKKVINEPSKIQTTLNFERIPRKSLEQPSTSKMQPEVKPRPQEAKPRTPQSEMRLKMINTENKPRVQQEKFMKTMTSPKEEVRMLPQPKTPVPVRSQPPQYQDTPRPSTSTAKPVIEPRRLVRTVSRSQVNEKVASVSPSTSRRKDSLDSRNKMDSADSIRDNVRKALQEQLAQRMAEHDGPKFSEDEIIDFANETELELNELFRDVGMKYKAKYRSLMFNIKDRKNLSLWQKICDKSITPKQLVRLSPEELASQELAQWREEENKHQLELIKKSELDLLAASKTYVLKTHKGEEVMETKESVSTELDPDAIPVEDVVQALNEETGTDEIKPEATQETKTDVPEKKPSRKRSKDDSSSDSKRDRRDSKRESESRKSRSSRRKSDVKPRDSKERRSARTAEKRSKRTPSEPPGRDHGPRGAGDERARRRATRERSRDKSRSRSRSRGNRSREPARRRRDRSGRSGSDDKQKHRSRSQENVYTKSKNDSTDSDSIERPKSAMLKEVHPEYDPHEPMITSAFSEEDLRKSREDVYEDEYKGEVTEFGNSDYDTSKAFSISTEMQPTAKHSGKQDKVSEAESDQEPSSTVENAAATVWNGCINMVDVARFYVAAHEVSGSASDLEEDLNAELDIVGRINPDTVWDYIGKTKRASNKDIIILRLQAANDEEKMQYIALYSYLSSRNRLGVVKVSSTTSVKDFYIVPLPANTPLPSVLLPLDGPGLADARTHLLIAIVIRQRKRRLPLIPQEVVPAKVGRESRKRSYTPPLAGKTYTPPASPRRRLPLPAYTSPALSTSVKDKIAASLASADDEEAYSPGSSTSSGSAPPSTIQPASNTLRSKMEELNRQIEEQKQQILKMAQADSSVGEDEAYSPSRPMTPPSVNPLADISLPSNLQEILATIKQRSEPAPSTDVDMRTLPLPQ